MFKISHNFIINNINVEVSFRFKSSACLGSHINNDNYPKLQYSLLVIRPKFGVSLQLYSDLVIKMK